MKSRLALSGLAFLLPIQFIGAEQVGNVRAGLNLAQQVCSECHAARADERVVLHPSDRVHNGSVVAQRENQVSGG